jgi:GTP-binding protein
MQCEKDAIEFYNLGLGEYYTFASISGRTELEILDAFINHFLLSQNQRKKKLNCPFLL